jgi:hypothetical protein
MSPTKEPNFFSCEAIRKQGLYYGTKNVCDLAAYRALFRSVGSEKAIGEASVSYLFYPDVAGKIRACVPDAKIVIVLRNPIERAFSHYLMDYRLGLARATFSDVVFGKASEGYGKLQYQQYVDLGMYNDQVKRYLEAFGRDQVKIFLFEELKDNGDRLIGALCQFLGVSGGYRPDTRQKYNAFVAPKNCVAAWLYRSRCLRAGARALVPDALKGAARGMFMSGEISRRPVMDEETRSHLKGLYENDIRQLQALLHRSLDNWR